jgi:hypothetical protein
MVDVAEEINKIVPDDTKEVKMPRSDRTGPNGDGPMTGKGMGYCSDNKEATFVNSGRGLRCGAGRNFGGGSGRGFRTWNNSNNLDQGSSNNTYLENEIKILKEKLNSLENKLSGK